MEQSSTNFVLILGGYVLSALVGIVAWFGNRQALRRDECARHLEQDVANLRASLEAWKILSTESHERGASATASVAGQIQTLPLTLGGIASDLKSISPRLAIIETRLSQMERTIDGKWKRGDGND